MAKMRGGATKCKAFCSFKGSYHRVVDNAINALESPLSPPTIAHSEPLPYCGPATPALGEKRP